MRGGWWERTSSPALECPWLECPRLNIRAWACSAPSKRSFRNPSLSFLAPRTPEGRAAVLGESFDDAAAALSLAFLAFAVIDLEAVLEVAEFARGLAMIADRGAAGCDRLIEDIVDRAHCR